MEEEHGEGQDESGEQEETNVDNQQPCSSSSSSRADILKSCLQMFNQVDYIMESSVERSLSDFFRTAGSPEDAVNALSQSYAGLPQMCNLLGEWMLQLDCEADYVRSVFENSLSTLIRRRFEPDKVDVIFEKGEISVDWLPDLIAHSHWRSTIYTLAEDYPDCLLLNFAVKLISDAGFQHEISNVNTAAQQLDIFSRVLSDSIGAVLEQSVHGADTALFKKAMDDIIKVACHSEHTYLYAQSLLVGSSAAVRQTWVGAVYRFISDSLRAAADERMAGGVTSLTLAMPLERDNGLLNPALSQAMYAMLTKRCLNPADMTLLYSYYCVDEGGSTQPPPADLIRDPVFLELLIHALFAPKVQKVHAEHRHKYVYLLAYAATVVEGRQQNSAKDELESTKIAVDRMSTLCQVKGGEQTSAELLHELNDVFTCLKLPVVATGLFHWIACIVTEENYFQLHPETLPIHLAVVDEIATNHQLLHSKIFKLLTELFVRKSVGGGDEETSEKIVGRQKMLIDRLIHLLSVGYALPVTEFMLNKFRQGAADISVVRYFVMETLDIMAPPYSPAFVSVFLPLVDNGEIVELTKLPAAKEFLLHCKETE